MSAVLAPELAAAFDADGVVRIPSPLAPSDLTAFDADFPDLPDRTAGARGDAFDGAARARFALHPRLLDIACALLHRPARLSRLQAFDKSPDANWFVPWHQDRAENGRERDLGVLERTVALRIHLDDSGEDSGPLEVVPASHRHGRLEAAAIAALVETARPVRCLVARGDIVAMRPLAVHRSQRATRPSRRRVLHFEYTA